MKSNFRLAQIIAKYYNQCSLEEPQGAHLEPIQTSKMKLFAEIVN